MSKIGVNISIDVTAIEKTRLVKHDNGKTYLNMTVFIDQNNPDKYGNHGMITQDISKEERTQGVKGAILGNAKVFWKEHDAELIQLMEQPAQGYQNLGGGQPYMQPVQPTGIISQPPPQQIAPQQPQNQPPSNPGGYANVPIDDGLGF